MTAARTVLSAFVLVSASCLGAGVEFAPSTAAGHAQEARVDDQGVLRWVDGSEVALWGVNYYPPFSLDYHAIKDKGLDHKAVMREDVDQFRLLGVDVIRLHCFDRQISDAEGGFIDNEHVELLDYLISLCASNGIKTVLTPIAWWWAKSGNGFSSRYTMKELVGRRDLWPIQQRYLREFLAHRNRYTGFTYGEDPAVVFFECINEPLYDKSVKDADVTAYADALAAAIRTGTSKPVFFNSWKGMNKAIGASGVDGITGSVYPTGLLSRHELRGSHLASVRESTLHPDEATAKKAKAIYEFDAADSEGAYFYPAFARLFRHEGVQMAAMFQYDPTALAAENCNWETHHLNLEYTPRKAVSFLVGGEAFRRLGRGCAFEVSERKMRFGPFLVDSLRDLSEMATEFDYLYSVDPVTPPPAPEKLRRVVGTGRSSVAESSGTGAYFLVRERPGVWTLRLFPSVFQTGNPFAGGMTAKFSRSVQAIDFAVHLPDLGDRFIVRDADDERTVARAIEGRVRLREGRYILVRRDICADRPEDEEFIDVDEALGYAAWKHGLRAGWWIALSRGKDDKGRPSLVSKVKKGAFTDEFPAEHLRIHRNATSLAEYFPNLGRGKAIRLRARSTSPKTKQVELALVMPGGYAWGVNVHLTPQWRDIEIPVERFRYFIQWGMPKPPGLELDLARVAAVNFCLGRWLLGDCRDDEHGFEVSSLRPVFEAPASGTAADISSNRKNQRKDSDRQ